MCDFSDVFDKLSFNELLLCQDQLTQHINLRKKQHLSVVRSKNIKDFVSEPVPFVAPDSVEYANILIELESLKLNKGQGPATTTTKWLTRTGQAYVWETSAGTPVVKDPLPVDKFPAINRALDKINKDLNLDLNSGLVSCLRDGRSNLRLHNDDEDSMDSSQPLVVLSFGATRTVDFLGAHQKSTETPAASITPDSGSMYQMLPGCQEYFKHRILANKQCRGARYSISFRCMKKSPNPGTVVPVLPLPAFPAAADSSSRPLTPPGVKSLVSQFEKSSVQHLKPKAPAPGTSTGRPAPSNSKPSAKYQRKRTTVLFGTSITTEVVAKRLGRKGRHVVNISESGADIGVISDMVDDFARFDPAAEDVEKVVLCFGTNDIKSAPKGVAFLKNPVFSLINKIKGYFPGVIILVMSTLPMEKLYRFTCPNVINFNMILRDASYKTNCYFIDCFSNFLSYDGRDYNRFLFYDSFHLNRRGLGILCSILKAVINCDSFSSVIRPEYGYF